MILIFWPIAGMINVDYHDMIWQEKVNNLLKKTISSSLFCSLLFFLRLLLSSSRKIIESNSWLKYLWNGLSHYSLTRSVLENMTLKFSHRNFYFANWQDIGSACFKIICTYTNVAMNRGFENFIQRPYIWKFLIW